MGTPTHEPDADRAAREKARSEVVAQALADNNTAPFDNNAPSFAAVLQPGYLWTEKVHNAPSGETVLPRAPVDGKSLEATIKYPAGNSALARAVRLHEMLHARFTPEVHSAVDDPGMEGITEVARQLAEDVRLARIGKHRKLFTGDAFFPDAVWNVRGPTQADLDVAALYISCYGQPLEGNWDGRSLSKFFHRTGAKVSRRTKKTLSKWQKTTERILGREDISARDQFIQLARAVQHALAETATRQEDTRRGLSQPPSSPRSNHGANANKSATSGQEAPKKNTADGDAEDATSREPSNEDIARKKLQELSQRARQKRQSEALKEALNTLTNPMLEKRAIPSRTIKDAANSATSSNPPAPILAPAEENKDRVRPHVRYRLADDGPRGPSTTDLSVATCYTLEVHPDAAWGTMSVHLAPLERNYRCALVKRLGAPSIEGANPKLVHRWFGDRHLFERQGLRRGGTLLIDVSGSMNWAHDITRKLIDATPAMTIAVYSSDAAHDELARRNDEGSGRGRLTIIGQGGKLVSPAWDCKVQGQHGNNNLIDGPALSWLTRMPRPRVWFSDGQVTGFAPNEKEGTNVDLHADAARICRLGVIRRTVDPKEVVKIFTGRVAT